MKIGIVIGRIGGIDGVALETEKWIAVLERMGHEVQVLTGQLEGPKDNASLLYPGGSGGAGEMRVSMLPELAFDHPLTEEGQLKAFFDQPTDEGPFLEQLEREARHIERGILAWVEDRGIQCLVSENASALPCHLTMGMALGRVFSRTGLPVVTHDHDFAWERGERYETPFAGVERIIEQYFPVKLPNVRHAVINKAARASLEGRFGIEGAVVVPNVMDFDEPVGALDDYNRDLRGCLGLAEDDVLLFQVTRIVARKGIETAIELVSRLEEPRVKLVITGTSTDDHKDLYLDQLEEQVARLNLQKQVLFAGDRFDAYRGQRPDGGKVFSLWDAYAHATACTYFSTYEGFGNAFVEAVVAQRPILVNNYEPVYWPDIGSLGFETVMIENGELTASAVQQTRALIFDADERRRVAEHNFELGKKHFSYQALEKILGGIFPA